MPKKNHNAHAKEEIPKWKKKTINDINKIFKDANTKNFLLEHLDTVYIWGPDNFSCTTCGPNSTSEWIEPFDYTLNEFRDHLNTNNHLNKLAKMKKEKD